jgi:copper transport protein
MAAVGVAVVGTAGPAAAHTHLESSRPAEGAVLDRAPERVVVDFSEALDARLTTAELTGEGGTPVPLPVQLDADDASVLVLGLPDLPDGVYRVAYRAFGTSDLHEVSGSIVFGVGAAPAVVGGEVATSARPGEVAARTTAHLGLGLVAAGLVLLAAVARVALPDDGRRRTARSLRRATVAGLAAIACGAIGGLIVDGVALGGPLGRSVWQVAVRSEPGHRAALVLELAALLAVLVVTQRPAARWGRALRVPTALWGRPTPGELGAGVTLGGLAWVISAGGHVGAGIPTALDDAVEVVHVLAASAWVGILLLVPVVVRAAGVPWQRALRSLAPVAEGLVVVAVASGLVLAAGRITTITALLTPGYGWIVLAKAGLVASAVALGLALRRTSRRRPTPGRARPAEAIAAVVIVALGGLLASTPPATGPAFDPPPAAPPTAWSGQAGDLAVRLSLSPNRPGTNLLTVDVHDTRRPAPGPITKVTVAGTGSGSDGAPAAAAAEAGRWDAGSVTVGPGELPLLVTVARAGLPDVTASVPWTVPPAPIPRHRPILSTAPLRPALDVAALAVVVIAAAAGTVLIRRRHHHPEVPDADRPRLDSPAPGASAATPRHPDPRHRRRGARPHAGVVER